MGFFDVLFGDDGKKSNGLSITGNSFLDFMIMEDILEEEEREARELENMDDLDDLW